MCTYFSLDDRLEYLRAYGTHTMAYSLLQRDMKYFDVPGVGFLGYRTQGGTAFILANPICAEHHWTTLVDAFLDKHPAASFVQITDPFCSLLRERFQFYTVQMGVETWIDGDRWDLRGRHKVHLRRWINTAKNAGLTITELTSQDMVQERLAVQNDWLKTRPSSHQLTFLTRHVYTNPALTCLTRLFGAYKSNELLGTVEFDPLFAAGNIVGYYLNMVQFRKQAPNGTSDLITSVALSQFVNEGARQLSFGMSPFAKLSPCPHEPVFVRSFGNWLYRHANFLYNFKGNYFHKEKYRGDEIPVYYATRRRNAIPEVIRIFHLIGVI